MPGDKEMIKKKTTQQKKVYVEDSSDESDKGSPQPKKSRLDRCTLSLLEAEPPKKSNFSGCHSLVRRSPFLASSPQKPKPSTTEVSCMTRTTYSNTTPLNQINLTAGILTKYF